MDVHIDGVEASKLKRAESSDQVAAPEGHELAIPRRFVRSFLH